MSILKNVSSFIQQVSEAIAAVIDFEVAVIDNNIQVVAGTGIYKQEIGNVYGEKSITSQLCNSGIVDTVYISSPNTEEVCKKCERIHLCSISGGLVCPIVVNEKVIGSLCIFSFNDRQIENLEQNRERLEVFVRKVALLISYTIIEKNMNEKISFMAEQFSFVIDSVHEGMIAIDITGKITHFNHSAEVLLKCKAKNIIGKSIVEVFPKFDYSSFFENKEKRIDSELVRTIENQQLNFVASITSIKNNDGYAGGAVISFRKKEEIYALANKYSRGESFTFNDIYGINHQIVQMKENMRRVATTDSTILIRGESGTGKELFARAIHNASLRKNKPFVTINCGAIPDNLLESELFGYEEGAFTGAKKGGKIGKFELANKGTILLDEIGDMPFHLQVKLLRVIEERRIERVGGVNSIPVDVRIIAATHQNLEDMISTNSFRSDLFYRLNVIPFYIPPLRERKDDISLLLRYFTEKFSSKMGKSIDGFSKEAEEVLLNYSWPGNVRELENTVEYAVNMGTANLIEISNLPQRIIEKTVSQIQPDDEIVPICELERRAIVKAINKFGNTTEGKQLAAKTLGISLTTVYRRLKN